MNDRPATRIIRAAVERAHADPPEPEPELGGLLARPLRREGVYLMNRHGRRLTLLLGTEAERDRIAAIVLGAVNPPLSGKEALAAYDALGQQE